MAIMQAPGLDQAWPNTLVIIDAGSSGSRAHIFRYRQASPEVLPDVQLPQQMLKLAPGLSSFSREPERAAEHVQQLLAWAEEQVRTSCPTGLVLHAPVGQCCFEQAD